jgi:integrase
VGKLTTLSVKSIKKVGLHADGGGLYLKVQKSKDLNQPNKSWIFRWGKDGKNTLGLGSLKHVTLSEARELAAKNHRLTKQGTDPRIERDKLKAEAKAANSSVTFEEAYQIYIETQKDGWKNKKHAQQWTNTLKDYAKPVIGHLPCSVVTTEHIVRILEPIWVSKHETATRLRQRIEKVMSWAAVMGHRTGENPAVLRGNLEHLLPKMDRQELVAHHKAMPYAQVPTMFSTIGANPSLSAKALLFCVLTASRTTEAREATWDEIDLDNKLWVIPKDRMKKKKEHRIPLSNQAVEVLKTITRIEGSPYVFNGQSRTKKHAPLSNMAMLNYLQKTLNHPEFTVHGFRSSFRDWGGESGNYQREVMEQALAHQLKDQAEAAYQRGDYMEKRKVLMNDWADYCFGVGAEAPAEAEAQQTSVT